MPLIESGYTQIENKILETICKSDLSLREIRVILVGVRYTNGFHRESTALSLSFLATATGIQLRHVQTTVKKLQDKNILVVVQNYQGTRSRRFKVNKDLETWKVTIDLKGNPSNELELTKKAILYMTDSDHNRDDQKSDQERKKKTIKSDFSRKELKSDLSLNEYEWRMVE